MAILYCQGVESLVAQMGTSPRQEHPLQKRLHRGEEDRHLEEDEHVSLHDLI